jgi:hypothetical protein
MLAKLERHRLCKGRYQFSPGVVLVQGGVALIMHDEILLVEVSQRQLLSDILIVWAAWHGGRLDLATTPDFANGGCCPSSSTTATTVVVWTTQRSNLEMAMALRFMVV